MDGEINFSREKRVFNLLDEHALRSCLRANLRERRRLKPVTRSLNADQFRLHAVQFRQLVLYVVRLPECERASTRPDAQQRSFFVLAALIIQSEKMADGLNRAQPAAHVSASANALRRLVEHTFDQVLP